MPYDGSTPPEDGNEYWWSLIHDAWITDGTELEDTEEQQ